MASLLAGVVTAFAAFAVYAAAAARTITWWDGSSYPLAACTWGIPPAPGSLLLTLLGGVVAHLPGVQPVAFRLNLLAGLIAATTAGLVTWLGIRLATPKDGRPGALEIVAGTIAGLTFAFGVTPWTYAVQFTPYVLSACFTALILVTALVWWDRSEGSGSLAWLFLLFLLFGLDLSAHRTNLLLLPGALPWVGLRSPRAWAGPRTWWAAGAGMALGLSFHLLLIPLAAGDPAFNMEDPHNLARLWSYVSLSDKGGGFLIDLFPRRASFWRFQLMDYLRSAGANLSIAGPRVLGLLPAVLALLGTWAAFRAAPRRTLGLLGFFLCGSLGAVIYFNLPHAYFRPIDRHYLPSFVVLAPLLAVGVRAALGLAARPRGAAGLALTVACAAGLALLPFGAWARNVRGRDLSRVRFAETVSRDVLEPLDERAILLTNGDNDTIPLWYLQSVEGVRRDVTVINLPLTNTAWFVHQLARRNPDLVELAPADGPEIESPAPVGSDSILAIPIDPVARKGVPHSFAVPETLHIHLHAPETGGDLFPQDRVIARLLRINRWRRPVYLAVTVDATNVPWLRPYARLDGMAFRLVPTVDPSVWDVDHLRRQLIEKTRYEGVADSTIAIDPDSQGLCRNYSASLFQLAAAQLGHGDPLGCLETLDFAEAHVPLRRLGAEQNLTRPLRSQAEAALASRRSASDPR
jgi:hypothetical protein